MLSSSVALPRAGGALVDRENRVITSLRVSLIDACNMGCTYCMPNGSVLRRLPRDYYLTTDEIIRLVALFAELGVNSVKLTGGEPLLRKDTVDIVQAIGSMPGIQDLLMTTNASLLADRAKALKKAGLHRLNVSLDSFREAVFQQSTQSPYFKQTIDGLRAALHEGFEPIKLNVVVMREINEDEAVDFAWLTTQLPLHVRFIEYMPIGPSVHQQRERFVSNDGVRERIEREFGVLTDETDQHPNGTGPATHARIPGAKASLGFISAMTHNFCHLCNRVRLTADGKFRLCLGRESEVDLFGPLRAGARDEDLRDLIQHAVGTITRGHDFHHAQPNPQARMMTRIGG